VVISKILFILYILEMFFETNQVNEALLCINCEGKLEEPKVLPCGETICSFCVTSLKIVDKMFDCVACKQKHEMPKDGLLNNKAFLRMLSIKPIKISRGKAFDNLQESLRNVLMNINLIKIGINDRDDFIKEHCIELRNDVQLVTEVAIQQINDFNIEIIKEIDEYEKEQLEKSKNTKKVNLDSSSVSFNDFLKNMQSFYDENIKFLTEYQIKDSILIEINEKAVNMRKKAEDKLEIIQRINLDERILKFDSNYKEQIDLGKITMIDNRMNSTLLSGRNQVKDLISLCEFPVDQKWNLFYRASRDGFEATNFHSKCDNKQNTLVIIKS